MRNEIIYSVAALAAFPIVVNAQVEAENIGKITAQKDGSAWTSEEVSLKPGKYTFKNTIVATGTAGKKATVEVLDGTTPLATKEVTVGEVFSIDFTLDAAKTVTFKVTNQDTEADFVADDASVVLNFNFSKVAELLQIEYNKVTQVLAEAQYDSKAADAQTYSALYDQILAIANADYAFYADNTELQKIYNDQTQVSGLTLYNNIVNALTSVKTNEVAYLDGSDGLGGLDTRYTSLKNNFGISYVTTNLTNKKTDAKEARDAFDSNPTAANLIDAKAKIAAYKAEIEKEEGVKTDNEDANNYLKAELDKVYVDGGSTSYYNTSRAQIATQYSDSRYADLKSEVEAALAAIVTGASNDYDPVVTAIKDQYKAKKSKAEKNNLINTIAEFKEKLTRVVSEYSTVREQLAAVYDIYDAQNEAANALAEGDATLKTYKDDVVAEVGKLLSFIKDNDKFATVANLTDDAIQTYLDAIATATNTYNTQSGIYGDYQALKDAVAAQTTSLNDAKTAVDADAKDTKKLDEAVFKPTTIWATTILDIEAHITTLNGNVDTNRATANTYKDAKAYKDALKKIKDQIAAFKTNALAATAKYAEINTLVTETEALRAGLLDTSVEPLKDVDLKALNVWSNQVTIDDAVKARTPYKNFIDDGTGSITSAIAKLATQLADAPNKKAVLNNKKDNKTNILPYLNGLDLSDVTSGNATLNAIKDNYSNDEQKFQDQIDQQECQGIITLINDKAVVFEDAIKILQNNITAKKYSNANAAKLQEEINAITAKIDAAKAVAAKAGATKAELTAAYNSIKDLATEDIKTAQDHAADYEAKFATSTGHYNTLKGETTDASTAQTLNGLTKKVTEEKAAIDALAKLTDAQKAALKGKVDAVQVVKSEGDPAADVTYTLTNITTAIETAWQNETLNASEVSRYQGIINDLKTEINNVKTQADRLNNLEGQLAAIDFNAAKTAILAKDPNQDGFYVKKLLGNAVAGECTFDFNKIKADIEADEDITNTEVNTYKKRIDDLIDTINGLITSAGKNLEAWQNAQKAYSADRDATNTDIWGNGGAIQQYEAAIAKLEAEYVTSKLEDQKMVLATLKEALDDLYATAETNYNEGTAASADDATIINNKLAEIKNKWEEFTNPVNYNGQVAADNKATYEAIKTAHAAADSQYAISSSIINTYKLFKSDELKAATEQAQAELQALLTYLEGYDAKVAEIQGRADAAYGKIVSPEKFDTEGSYKAEFEAVEAELKTKTQALSDKIKEFGGANVVASVEAYTAAIATSKAKVAKFSSDENDLPEATVNGLFSGIDAMLTAITDVQNDDTKIKSLDNALAAAEADGSGINDQITSVEQTQAVGALKNIVDSYSNWGLLSGSDKSIYYSIYWIIDDAYSGYNDERELCVNNFANYKQDLNSLKTKAEQIKADNAAIAAATTAIKTANFALAQLVYYYQQFAAGAQVKATIDQIAAELKAHPADYVTVANSSEWKAFANDVYTAATSTTAESGRIINVYNDLFDAEVTVIEGLIAQAKEENLTYGGADKATISTRISDMETSLAAAKEAVAKASTETGYKTKKNALLTDLSSIEAVLNADILTMTTGNETNVNDIIMANLTTLKGNLQTRLNNSLNELYNSYQDVYGNVNSYYDPYKPSIIALNTTKSQIQGTINDLGYYLNTHEDEIVAYQANARAMMTDIDAAITNLESAAQAEQTRQYNQFVQDDENAINTAWNTAEGYITKAQKDIDDMNAQLGFYGSASKYANKVKQLEDQVAAANTILTNAKTEAESLTTLKGKYDKATATGNTINPNPPYNGTLVDVTANSQDIINLAKAAYIDAFIAKLDAQVIADTWTASANYTNTDKNALTTMWNKLKTFVTTLKFNAKGFDQAEILYHPYYGYEISAGVIATLERGETVFNEDLAALKQALKDMSLAEDVKGHVSGNDEISTDDLEDLADIILNAEEDSADLERCDMNGDGEVDVTDLVWLRYFLVHDEWPTVAAPARGGMVSANDYINMEVVSVENNVTRIAINLDNETVFNHFQLNVQLPDGAKVVSRSLGERVEGANLMMAQNESSVRLLAISTANNVFAGNNGAVVYLDIEGLNGEVNIEKAIFTDTELNGHLLTANSTTSIRESITNALQNAGQKIYNMGGKMMNGLKKGINIIRNADGSATKVIKK